MRILVVSQDAAFVGAVRDVLAAQMTDASCEPLDEANLRSRPNGALLVIDGRDRSEHSGTFARRVRAMGFAGGILVVGTLPAGLSGAMGVVGVAPERVAHELMPALVEALEQAGSPLGAEVMRARRLVAAGEMALHLQHDINNPLAGLLAELQLMQMDPLSSEHSGAVERMLVLCRRLMALTRGLDGIGERKP